jgi:hypothetical protein
MEHGEAVDRLKSLNPAQLELVHFLLEVDVTVLPGTNEALTTRVIALYRLLKQDARKLALLPIVLDSVILGHSSRAAQHHARVHEALSRLDFIAQVRAFRDTVETQRLCAFVIHGPPETGHTWLLNRLKLLLPRRGMQAKRILHSCAQRSRKPGLDAVLDTLRRGLGFDVTATPVEELARRACKIRETQDLLIIIDAVESLDDEHVLGLVERFWGAVVDAAGGEAGERAAGFHLILFLLSHAEQEAGWARYCADCATGTWKPRVPIKLPRLASFPADLLRAWIETHTDTLPRPLRDAAVAAELFARCEQGLPLLVFEDICRKWLAELEESERSVIFEKLDRRWWKLEA